MKRILAGAAVAALLLGAAAANAASTKPAGSATPAATTMAATAAPSTASAPVDYGARCTSLAEQWKTAETANASNANLGKAKEKAKTAASLCKSKKSSDHKTGAEDYEAALKLLGVTPT